jgi:hypothetical protein
MILQTYTFIHVLISLVGIASGFVVAFGLIAAKRLGRWTKWFLWTTALTDITGFFFPFHGFKPSYVVGLLSLIVLAIAYAARYSKKLAGGWRTTYVISAVIGLYLNTFVLIVQSFLKIPALHMLAPTQTEPAFKTTQLVVLAAFIVLGIAAAIGFRKESPSTEPTPFKPALV